VHDVCKDLGLKPEKTVVYICGNPDMILNVERVLMDDGFPEFHVKKELYWPKGKTRRAAPPALTLRRRARPGDLPRSGSGAGPARARVSAGPARARNPGARVRR
jgi:ferredoxin-NADP reductase